MNPITSLASSSAPPTRRSSPRDAAPISPAFHTGRLQALEGSQPPSADACPELFAYLGGERPERLGPILGWAVQHLSSRACDRLIAEIQREYSGLLVFVTFGPCSHVIPYGPHQVPAGAKCQVHGYLDLPATADALRSFLQQNPDRVAELALIARSEILDVDWSALFDGVPPLTSVQVFHVYGMEDDVNNSTSFGQLTWQAMPRLGELVLQDVCHQLLGEELVESFTQPVPGGRHLDRLVVRGSAGVVANVLADCAVPDNANIAWPAVFEFEVHADDPHEEEGGNADR